MRSVLFCSCLAALLVATLSNPASPTGNGMSQGSSMSQGSGMSQGMGAMTGPSGAGNFNLSTMQGIQGFLNMEGINPSQIVTTNCVLVGNQCTTSGQPCCGAPVFTCQGSSGSSICRVIPAHVPHIPQIRQIAQTLGISTPNPVI